MQAMLIHHNNTIIRTDIASRSTIESVLGGPLLSIPMGSRLIGFSLDDKTLPINDEVTTLSMMEIGSDVKKQRHIRGSVIVLGLDESGDLTDCPSYLMGQLMLHGIANTIVGKTPRYVEKLYPNVLVRAVERHDHYLDKKPNTLRFNVTLVGGVIADISGFY